MSPDVPSPSPHPNRTSLPSVIPPPSATPAFTPTTIIPSATNTATTNASTSTSTSTTTTPLNPFSQPHQPPVLSSLSSPPTAANSANPSPHTLIPASSFGPPSPTSSTSSSPRLNHFDFTGFQQAFPSIDELDEMAGLVIPSNPTGGTGTSSGSGGGSRRSSNSKHSGSSLQNYNHTGLKDDIGGGGGGVLAGFPPIHAPKAFPALPLDPGPRPSSTPIPPTIDTFVSRPASPSVVGRSPMSPSVPRKPSGLGLNSSLVSTSTTSSNSSVAATTITTGVPLPLPNPIPIPIHASASVSSTSNAYQPTNRSPLISGSGTLTPTGGSSEKRELPFTTLFPRTLLECMQKGSGFKVLLLDVRTREEFRKERLNVDTVVCIEPSVLLRDR